MYLSAQTIQFIARLGSVAAWSSETKTDYKTTELTVEPKIKSTQTLFRFLTHLGDLLHHLGYLLHP